MRRDWLGLGIRVVSGAVLGFGIGLLVSLFQMGMNATWPILAIPTLIGAIWGARCDE